jgi:hypothetical protein
VAGGHGIGNLIMLEAIIFMDSFQEIWNSPWIWVVITSIIGQILILFTMIRQAGINQTIRYLKMIGLLLLIASVAIAIIMVTSYSTQGVTAVSSIPFFVCGGVLIYKMFFRKGTA